MSRDSDILISDTSCLILLSKIGELQLLKAVGRLVIITPTIQQEFGNSLPDWISVCEPKDAHYAKILEVDLDEGEASAIALSLELDNVMLILDDLKGRKMAERLGLNYSGTFGLILRAKRIGAISSILPILEKIRTTDFRFSETLFTATLAAADEH